MSSILDDVPPQLQTEVRTLFDNFYQQSRTLSGAAVVGAFKTLVTDLLAQSIEGLGNSTVTTVFGKALSSTFGAAGAYIAYTEALNWGWDDSQALEAAFGTVASDFFWRSVGAAGTVEGEVINVSRDANQDEKQGLIYPVRVRLDAATIDVDGKPVAITPGMAVERSL